MPLRFRFTEGARATKLDKFLCNRAHASGQRTRQGKGTTDHYQGIVPSWTIVEKLISAPLSHSCQHLSWDEGAHYCSRRWSVACKWRATDTTHIERSTRPLLMSAVTVVCRVGRLTFARWIGALLSNQLFSLSSLHFLHSSLHPRRLTSSGTNTHP